MSKKLFLLVFSTLLRNPHIAQKLYLTCQQMKDIVQGLLLLIKHDAPPKDILVDNMVAAPEVDDDDISVLACVDLDNPSEP